MSEVWHYIRATVDIATTSERLAKKLLAEGGGEHPGRWINDAVMSGRAEIDAANDIEDHGTSDNPGRP